MQITGAVVDQSNGKPLPNATVWEITPDGQSAQVIGFTDYAGRYDVNVYNAGSSLNFVIDGYTGVTIPASQAMLSDQVLLPPDGTLHAKISLSGFPSWLWLLVGGAVLYWFGNPKKVSHK